MSTFFTLADLKTTPLKNTPVNFVKVYVKENNLKYLNAAGEELDVVLDRPLENFTLPGTASPVTSSDTIATALGKIQATLDSATGIGGTSYVYVAASGTDVENAAELQAAYTTAKTMSPSATNRITIVAAPGYYNFEASTFVMDTQYIDLVSLDGNRSIVFNSSDNTTSYSGTISVTANDVFIKGVNVMSKSFNIGGSFFALKLENCQGGDYSFGGDTSFFSPKIVSSTFINCQGGYYSFGGSQGGTTSGTFINCVSGADSFGQIASGIFESCKGGMNSFGGNNGTASGVFTNCTGGNNSFGGYFGTASGTFNNCKGDNLVFGSFGTISGVFTNCEGLENSFGTNASEISGTLINCIGGNYSFAAPVTGTIMFGGYKNFSQASPSVGIGGSIIAFVDRDKKLLSTGGVKLVP